MSWRDEQRADRAAAAEQRRADQQLAHEQRRADLAARAEQMRADAAAAEDRKAERAAARKAQIKAATDWCTAHVIELLFIPVIVVPALLAWTAMGDYGNTLYGPIGRLLPVFSEGAMWVFAAATTLSRKQDPDRPVVMLQAGTWIFGAVAAALNFTHGLSGAAGRPGGSDVGLVMALVSIAGVVAHQIITAGPRRTRAERADAAIARQVARREHTVRQAAVRHAVAELAEDGTARLIYRAGTVTLARSLFGRRRLVEAVVPGRAPAPVPGVDAVADELADEIASWLSTQPGNASGTAETPDSGTGSGKGSGRVPALLARVRAAITEGRLPADPSRREVQRFLRVRAALATEVTRALKSDGPGGVPART